MPTILRLAALLPIAALCAGCEAISRVEKSVKPSGDDAIFVIGSAPENFRVWVSHADIIEKDGAVTVKGDQYGFPVLVANPENGFLVGKVRGGSTLALTGVRMVSAKETIGPGFSACGGNTTMVFTAPAGKVVYVGSVRLTRDGEKIFARYSSDFDSARKHIDGNYPNLRGRTEQHDHRQVQTSPCPTGTMVITVPLPGR
jgi:hypothetical protein